MWKLIRYRLAAGIATRPAAEILRPDVQNGAAKTSPREWPEELALEWRERVSRSFGGSLHIRHVDSGSCNACEWELSSLLNPVYDVQRLGIDFVASPRHADVLVVTGGVTRNLAEALQMTYAAAARPKAVVALGACACGDGLPGETYAQAGRVDPIVPVSIAIPGCPPRPQEILHGLLEVMRKLDEGRNLDGHGGTAV